MSTSPPPRGPQLAGWTPPPPPPATPLAGDFCRLEPLVPEAHAAALHAALAEDREGTGWTYMAAGPFADAGAFRHWAEAQACRADPLFHVIDDGSGPAGLAAYLRIAPEHGRIEIGHIILAPRLKHTTAATEALCLLMRRAFDELGYRRLEWKCDALNAPSRRAATRLGFVFEGVFRQHMIVKGRNRDTAWYAMTDTRWRALAPGFAAWLAETGPGPQTRPLGEVLARVAG